MNQHQQGSRRGTRAALILSALVIVVVGGLMWFDRMSKQFFHAVLVGETGPVNSAEDWPRPLKALRTESDRFELNEDSILVYCLCHGVYDLEYVWRMESSPGLLEHIVDKWRLVTVDKLKWPTLRGTSSISGIRPPSWWSPSDDDGTSFYEVPRSIGEGRGDRFWVAVDKDRQTMFVWYWFNF